MGEMYGIIEQLCIEKGIKPGRLCTELGISRGIMSDLKVGRTKKLSAENLGKVASYLGVSTDYLLGKDTERAHYEKLDDLYYNAVIKWSEDKFFSEEETTAIKMHFADLLIRYKDFIESTVSCKLSFRRYLESISTFNSECEKPLTTQELIERYLSQESAKELSDLKSWIDAAPYYFSLALEKSLDLEQSQLNPSSHPPQMAPDRRGQNQRQDPPQQPPEAPAGPQEGKDTTPDKNPPEDG